MIKYHLNNIYLTFYIIYIFSLKSILFLFSKMQEVFILYYKL